MRIVHCLPVDVYRFRLSDCSNGGVSSFCDELLVACESGHRTFDADQEIPLNFCMVRKRSLYYAISHEIAGSHIDIVPATIDEAGRVVPRPGWWMFGGNIADSCDSRFHDLTGHYYPLHIHDRKEW